MKAATWFPVLQLLASGELISGAALGATLGLTRAAIWQRVTYLRALGLPVHADESGYRLEGGAYIPLASVLSAKTALPVHIEPELVSTNAQTMAKAPTTQCVLAIYQSGGRGRRGRTWTGVPGRSLMLSLGRTLALPAMRLSGLSIAVGVALCEFLRGLGADAQLKWPNDVWVDQRKLAGLLMELQGGVHDTVYVVLGLGLNIKPVSVPGVGTASIEEVLGRAWGDDDTAGLLRALDQSLQEFSEREPETLVEAFHRVSALTGRSVVVNDGNHTRVGVMAGIDRDGAMLLMTDSGLVTLMAGDVSVRAIG